MQDAVVRFQAREYMARMGAQRQEDDLSDEDVDEVWLILDRMKMGCSSNINEWTNSGSSRQRKCARARK